MTQAESLLSGQPAGTCLLRLGLHGLTLSFVDGLGVCRHSVIPKADVATLAPWIAQPTLTTAVLSAQRCVQSGTVAKNEILALFNEEYPLASGFVVPWVRPRGG